MRSEVRRLAAWAPLSAEDAWEPEALEDFDGAVQAVQPPLTHDEALALVSLLDRPHEGSIYGLLWGVLHLIESYDYADWVPEEIGPERPWLEFLHLRWVNAGRPRGGSRPETG